MIDGYKETSLGLIPKSWEVNHLGKICDVRDGTHDSPKYHDTGIPFITSKNLTETELCFENIKFISKEDHINFSKRSHVENGDILFGMIGTVGKPIIVNEDFEFSIKNVALLKFSNAKKLDNSYALNILKSSIVDNQFKKMSNGGVLKFVALGNIRNLVFPLPPLPEQQKIAEILSTVDNKIEVIDQQIIETQALKKGLMQRLLTKGIGHTEFKDSTLGMIPKSWKVSSLVSHSAFITKGSTPTTYGYQWEESGIQFLRSECVSPRGFILSGAMFISEQANDALERSKIKGGDILMTITGNVGRVCVYPVEYLTGNINQHIARIRITDDSISSQFVFQFLSQPTQIHEYLKITTGQAYPQLSLKQVRETKIPVPSLGEQLKISEILSSVDSKLGVLSEKKNNYQELKQGLMQQLLTGKIRVKV
jgi:type I restriction enzyme S subunit